MAPQHETTTSRAESTEEWIEAVINVIINVAFVVGSILFFEDLPLWCAIVGDLIFIIGSFVAFLIAARKLMVPGWRTVARRLMQREKQGEVIVTLSYCVSSFIFFIGSFFFYPGIYPDEDMKIRGEKIGAWLFVAGSFGFVIASFYSMEAMGHSDQTSELDPTSEAIVHHMHKLALLATCFGSNLFVVGSVLFRPGFNTHCKEVKNLSRSRLSEGIVCEWFCTRAEQYVDSLSSKAQELVAAGCADNLYFGTWCYVIGSVLFFVASVFELRMINLKQRCTKAQAVTKKAK